MLRKGKKKANQELSGGTGITGRQKAGGDTEKLI